MDYDGIPIYIHLVLKQSALLTLVCSFGGGLRKAPRRKFDRRYRLSSEQIMRIFHARQGSTTPTSVRRTAGLLNGIWGNKTCGGTSAVSRKQLPITRPRARCGSKRGPVTTSIMP
jgi:hypothetical protein